MNILDIGLGLCRRYGLYNQRYDYSASADSSWADYRTAWRTLLFMSTSVNLHSRSPLATPNSPRLVVCQQPLETSTAVRIHSTGYQLATNPPALTISGANLEQPSDLMVYDASNIYEGKIRLENEALLLIYNSCPNRDGKDCW